MALYPKEPHVYEVRFGGNLIAVAVAHSTARAREAVVPRLEFERVGAARALSLGASEFVPVITAPQREDDDGQADADAAQQTLGAAGLQILPVTADDIRTVEEATSGLTPAPGESALAFGTRVHEAAAAALDASTEPTAAATQDAERDFVLAMDVNPGDVLKIGGRAVQIDSVDRNRIGEVILRHGDETASDSFDPHANFLRIARGTGA